MIKIVYAPTRKKLHNLLEDRYILTTSQIGQKLYPEAMDKDQPQGTQALLAREVKQGSVLRIKPNIPGSREYAYHRSGRNYPKRKANHTIMVNWGVIYIEFMDNELEIIEKTSEYQVSKQDGKFLSKASEELPDGTIIIPDIRVRLRNSANEQVIWMIECDTGSESIMSFKYPYMENSKGVTEGEIGHALNPSSLAYKVHKIRAFINQDVWTKYEGDGKVVAVQNLYLFCSELRLKRFRETVLDLVGRDQPFIWMAVVDNIKAPRDFWHRKIWTKAVFNPELFSLINDEGLEIDRFAN